MIFYKWLCTSAVCSQFKAQYFDWQICWQSRQSPTDRRPRRRRLGDHISVFSKLLPAIMHMHLPQEIITIPEQFRRKAIKLSLLENGILGGERK